MADSKCEVIQLDEEIEGDIIETSDYFFDKIGASVPLTSDVDFQFDLQNVASCPLAVSEKFKLMFVAHSSGFWVARTKDVVDSAMAIKENKDGGSCIQELSILDVQIGKVHILSLSADSSMLAATVGGDIHFFPVESLLSEEQNPTFSCSLEDSAYVKDFHWIKKFENSFAVLSNHGRLYHGELEVPLTYVIDNVDAVEWSVRGNLVAVARGNILTVLSSKFKERFRVSLSFKTCVFDANCTVQVDSIKWVRPDCIILGCLQLTADGMEENYFVQVIEANNDKFTDGSSDPVVLSFCDLFLGLIDDILPSGSGPYLFLNYLDQCELAVAVNRKNTDQHVVLIGWSKGDENNKATVVDIARDKWLPRIELQENGDDNLVLGLSVDKVSVFGKVKVQIGVEDEKELPPYCVLFCLTLDGKVTMYHVASLAETAVESPVDCIFPDEEEEVITASVASGRHDISNVSPGSAQGRSEDVAGDDMNQKGLLPMKISYEFSDKKDLSSSEWDISAASKGIITGIQEVHTLPNLQISEEQQNTLKFGQDQDTIGQQWPNSSLRNTGFNIDPSFGKSRIDTVSQLTKNSQKFIDEGKESPWKIESTGLQSFQVLSNGKSLSFKDPGTKFVAPASSSIDGHKFLNNGLSAGNGNADTLGYFSRASLFPKVTGNQSEVVNSSSGATQIGGQNSSTVTTHSGGQRTSTKTSSIDPLPSIRNSQFKLHNDKPSNVKPPTTSEKYRSPSSSVKLSAEPKLSKQFGNIKDMTKELDALLDETCGFMDASTHAQRDSLVALEQGMVSLSEKCTVTKSTLDERRTEVQHLLNNTVQVLARKTHIKGILEQATDKRYWDFWNRQKLSPELELKRRHILEVTQGLTSQLIELERHFNTLELNRFGDDSGSSLGHKSHARVGPSRKLQSLHSLHCTMNSQLAAAEQLSECLSKQMTVLKIESPEKRHDVRKELFETIGIPYDVASFSSPVAPKANDTSIKKLPSSSNSVTIKEQSRRKQSSLIKISEPETARRRRDSLDRSWVSYEPSKTTVKRSVMQEIQKVKANKTLFSTDKQQPKPHMFERSISPQPITQTRPSSFYPPGNKGNQDSVPKQASESFSSSLFKLVNDVSPPSQLSGSPTPQIKQSQAFSFQSVPGSSPAFSQSNTRDSANFTVEGPKSNIGFTFTHKFDSALLNEKKSNLQPKTGSSFMPTNPPCSPALAKSTEISNLNSKEAFQTAAASGSLKQPPVTSRNLSFESGKNDESLTSRTSSDPPVPKFSGWNFQNDPLTSKLQAGDKALLSSVSPASPSTPSMPSLFSASSAAKSSLPALSSNAVTSSAPVSFNGPSAPLSTFAMSSLFSTSAQSSLPALSSTAPASSAEVSIKGPLTSAESREDATPSAHASSSFQSNETLVPTYFPSSPLSSASESSQRDVQVSAQQSSLKIDDMAAKAAPSFAQAQKSTGDNQLKFEPSVTSSKKIDDMAAKAAPSFAQAQKSTGDIQLKFEPSVTSTSSIEVLPTKSSLSNVSSPVSSAFLNTQPEHAASPVAVFSQAPILTFPSVMAGNIDSANGAATQDEMEEEASETNQAAQVSFGSFGDFGLGSAPNPAAPKANPFGASFSNAPVNAASTSFTLTNPTGGLFRPASLTFPSSQPSQQPPVSSPFSGGFGIGATTQSPSGGGFGQPAQVGPGQQVLGSVLGGFGQSRQLGAGSPISGFAAPGGFGGGFASSQQTGGFAKAATGGGFAGAASGGGGFAALASGAGGGFAGAAAGGGGFASLGSGGGGFAALASGGGGGFAGAAASGSGFSNAGGFGAFNNQQGSGGGFSAFGNTGTGNAQSELFTQPRR